MREVLVINRFIYASSVQQPNAGLLGSDSECSSIKSFSDTRLAHTQTHTYNDFVNHMVMYSQSQRLVTSAQTEECTCSTHHMCKARKKGVDLESPCSTEFCK